MEIRKMKKLLVISCTERKSHLYDRPALEVYDGPSFRILRKHINDGIDVLIISAMYGVINPEFKISEYNLKMTRKRSLELRKSVSYKIDKALRSGIYDEVFFELGKIYRESLDLDISHYSGIHIEFDTGTIGTRLHNLKTWLKRSQQKIN